MSFEQRHEEIIKKAGPLSTLRLSIHTVILGMIIFAGTLAYNYFYNRALDLVTVNSAFALTAVILIGLSFALSGLCYFWDFVDTKIVYRKYLGLTGFGFGLLHAATSFNLYLPSLLNPDGEYVDIFNAYQSWDVFGLSINNFYAFLSGVAALLIFTMMALISNRYAVHELGGKRWRQLLRVGYIAYLFVVFHFAVKKVHLWAAWAQDPFQLPPPSLPLVLFVLAVLILRAELWIDLRRKKREKNKVEVTQTPSEAPPAADEH